MADMSGPDPRNHNGNWLMKNEKRRNFQRYGHPWYSSEAGESFLRDFLIEDYKANLPLIWHRWRYNESMI
jgi:hypothetical protein